MRSITARLSIFDTYRSADQAILGAQQQDAQWRSFADDCIRGKIIEQILWSDDSVVCRLDDGCYLNCVARPARVQCYLSHKPYEECSTSYQEETPIFNGSIWNRQEISKLFINKPLKAIFFSSRFHLFVYIGNTIMGCYHFEGELEGKTFLGWDETD